MKIKTSELINDALDWAVAKCEHIPFDLDGPVCWKDDSYGHAERILWKPSTDWAQGGPIIEREVVMFHSGETPDEIRAYLRRTGYALKGCSWAGPTHLVAAMRAWVGFKLGDEVDVPEELK